MFGGKKHKNRQGRVAGHMAARPGAIGGGGSRSASSGGAHAAGAPTARGGSRDADYADSSGSGSVGVTSGALPAGAHAVRGSASAEAPLGPASGRAHLAGAGARGGSHAAGKRRHAASGSGKAGRRPRLGSKASAVLSVLLVLAGVAALAYPFVSNWLASQNHMEAIAGYSDASNDTTEAEREAMLAAAEEYNESLAGDPVHDPFVVGSGYAIPDNYDEVLNVDGEGTMGYLEIPSIGVNLPIYHGTSDEVLAKGVGHISNTSLPIGGEGRHSVLTGHRGLPSAELFTRLDELKEGDLVLVTVLGETHAYRVYGSEVVEPDDLSSLVVEKGRDLLTLVTCTPYAVNTHRLLVHSERTDYTPAEAQQQADEGTGGVNIDNLARIAGLVASFVVLVVAWRMMRKHGRGGRAVGGRAGGGRAGGGRAGAGGAGAGGRTADAGGRRPGGRAAGGLAAATPMQINNDDGGAVGLKPLNARAKRGAGSHLNTAGKRTKGNKGGGKHAR